MSQKLASVAGHASDWQTLGRISSALDDLPVPYRFSLVILGKKLDADVAAHIGRVGVPVYEKRLCFAGAP